MSAKAKPKRRWYVSHTLQEVRTFATEYRAIIDNNDWEQIDESLAHAYIRRKKYLNTSWDQNPHLLKP